MSKFEELFKLMNDIKRDVDEATRMKRALLEHGETSFGLEKDSKLIAVIANSLDAYIKEREDSISVGPQPAVQEVVLKPIPHNEPLAPNKPIANVSKEPAPKVFSRAEKAAFAMENRELGGQRITIPSGIEIPNVDLDGRVGEVVALDVPFIVLKLDVSGEIIKLTKEQLGI